MRNRFCDSFRMAENAKRTPELTRKVKNCNVPRNKIKSAIFWQKSYRLEWYLIICHYLNLYVHCISFITRLFLLWKLTGAKSNFETMCLQERNLWYHRKGVVIRNTHAKYESPTSEGEKVISKPKVWQTKFSQCRSKATVKVTCTKSMVPSERCCHKEHTCQIWKSSLWRWKSYKQTKSVTDEIFLM